MFAIQFEIEEIHLSLNLFGHVVWSTGGKTRHPPGMAFAFDQVHPELRSILDQYITVSAGLSSVDGRIGQELPLYLQKELPVPEPQDDEEDTVEYLLAPNEYPV